MQQADGSFRAPITLDERGAPYGGPLSDTMYALRALALLDAEPADRTLCTAWLISLDVGDALVPTWALAESIGILGALGMWIGGDMIDRWDSLEFSADTEASIVSFEAYAAVRTRQLIDETTALDSA